MDDEIVKISSLLDLTDSELQNVFIKASVSVKSIRHGNSRHAYFYMDLRDDSGEITAVVYIDNESPDNELYIIEENKTYMMTIASLEVSNKRYTSIKNDVEIVLNSNCEVQLCGHAPKVEWLLTPLNDVYNKDAPTFFNIIGLCTRVSETRIMNGELTRQVTLIDEFKFEITLNIWNQETSLFDELDLKFHPVFFVKDARIYKYRDHTGLTTSRYLQLLNPDDPRAVKIRKAIHSNKLPAYHNLNMGQTVATMGFNQQDEYPYCTSSNVTKKNRNYIKISQISDSTPNLDSTTIVASVTMKSYKRKSPKGSWIVMDLSDETGQIVAKTEDEAWLKFNHLIEKNRTYSITGFSVGILKKGITSIVHQKLLILNNNSEVKLCGIAPKIVWPISPLIVVHKDHTTEFFHAFGLCKKVNETDDGWTMTLVDQLSRELILKLNCDMSMIVKALDLNTHPVFFVKDAKMSDTNKCDPILNMNLYLELLEPGEPRACRVTEALLP